MSLKVVNSGEVLMLTDLKDGVFNEATVHLFQNDHVPADDDTLAAYTEADYSGYASQEITAWVGPFLNSDEKAEIVGPTLYFHPTGSPPAETNTIYGYFVKSAAGALLYAERFPESMPMTLATDAIVMVPVFTLNSEV